MRIQKLPILQFPRVHKLGSQSVRTITDYQHPPTTHPNNDLFNYTSGRWIYNEQPRLLERTLPFNIPALKNVIAAASNRPSTSITSLSKLSEGGFNRIIQATFKDGRSVLARLPYPSTQPEHYTVSSEVATLAYLRQHGFPTPEVYAWCANKENPVGAEYIIMEKMEGIPLGEVWYSMTPKEMHKVMRQVVELETRLMALDFPACGSIYFRSELPAEEMFPLSGEFCIGPMAHYSWWRGERGDLDIDRGPWPSPTDIFRAVGERELTWTKLHAKARQPFERLYREIHQFSKISPDSHIKNLTDYLKLAPHLGFQPGTPLNRPVLRHPDLQPNNILISDTHEIIGLIDWQHSSILPLGLAASMPKHFQNYGDPESDCLRKPQTDFPSGYDSLSQSEQVVVRETLHKRLIHFLYAAFTNRFNNEHYDAIFDSAAILRQRLLESAGAPWEGDSVSLRAELINTIHAWRELTPLSYSEKDIQDTLSLHAQHQEADAAMDHMRQILNIDIQGWVPNEEYPAARDKASEIKARMLEAAETPEEVTEIGEQFPFDDFDEGGLIFTSFLRASRQNLKA
ncbi:kinase-like protein [Aspergillus campestris IBT 28561]|uniref:Kinase-like protein n=1 Tax=Aspergillus campestris (strain IBT 28561) TaxID=1392248 RepID=A0A2I1D9F0_ASPC2|nr:kinase-like protein [Aspergillus campestris IBT 28561]PKY06504.1 kinase-like protein [Aspergillus campestris IBT 28561]